MFLERERHAHEARREEKAIAYSDEKTLGQHELPVLCADAG